MLRSHPRRPVDTAREQVGREVRREVPLVRRAHGRHSEAQCPLPRRVRGKVGHRAEAIRALPLTNERQHSLVDERVVSLLEGVAECIQVLEHLDGRAPLLRLLRPGHLKLQCVHAPLGKQVSRRVQHLRLVSLDVRLE